MQTFKEIFLKTRKKDIWGKKLSGIIEDYFVKTINGIKVEFFYDNSKTFKPWTAFVMGKGSIAHGNSKEEVVKNGIKAAKSFSKKDIEDINNYIQSLKDQNIIRK